MDHSNCIHINPTEELLVAFFMVRCEMSPEQARSRAQYIIARILAKEPTPNHWMAL